MRCRRGCKRLDTSTQGEYTKSKAAYENLKETIANPATPTIRTRQMPPCSITGDKNSAPILHEHPRRKAFTLSELIKSRARHMAKARLKTI
jgi:hypothetical protein